MTSSKRNTLPPLRSDAWLFHVLAVASTAAACILVLIVLFMLREAWPVLQRVGFLRFLSDPAWHPAEELYGLAPMLAASLAIAAGAVLLAGPSGVASALFIRFYAAAPFASAFRLALLLLAGLPSVVLGLWGLTVLVPLIGRIEPPGASLIAGVLVLALMILPTIALTTEAALDAMPESYLRGAAALGLSRESTILGVILPTVKGSIMAGLLLSAARALGETVVLLMVTGNVVQLPASLFDPVRALTANIALEMAYAMGDHRAALFVSGLMVAILVLFFVLVSRRLGGGWSFNV